MGGHRDEEAGRRRRHHQPKQYHPPPDASSSRSPSHEHRRTVQRSEGMTPRSAAQGRFPSSDAPRRDNAMPPSIHNARSSTMPYKRRPSDPRTYPGDDPAAYPPPRRYSAGHGGSSYESRRYGRRESAPLYEDVPRMASPDPVTSSDASESEEEESSEDEEASDEEDSEHEEVEADDEASISRRRGRQRPEKVPEPPGRYPRTLSPSSDEDDDSSVPASPSDAAGARLRRRAIEATPQPRMIEAPPFRREPRDTPSPRTSRSRVSSVRAEARPPVSTKRPSKRKTVIHHESTPTRSRNTTPSTRASTRSSSHRRPTNVLGDLLPASNGHRTSPQKTRSKDRGKDKVIKSVECVACMENKSQVKAPKLKCGHRMCHPCLKQVFELSTKDPQSMPPKCCAETISLKHVDPLFDDSFKRLWNRKNAEYKTKNRVYCPSKKCGEWIKPSLIKHDGHRQSARCGRCNTKVCISCHSKWHSSPDCPRDEETQRFLKQAKEEGWQRCYSCRHMVERQQGCNHMTCRCGAQFCMVCGVKWRNCDCEWFNFETDDNLGGYYGERANAGDPFEGDAPPVPRLYRGSTEPLPRSSARPRSRHREEPRYYRHAQEQQDEDLARRLQYEMSLSGDDSEDSEEDDVLGDGVGLGISGGRAASEHYERRRRGSGRTTLPPAPEPPIGRSYEREQTYPSTRKYETSSKYETPTKYETSAKYETPSKYESPAKYETSAKYETAGKYERGSYVTEVHRARGSRGSKGERSRSMEKRLANRLSESRYNTPGRDMPMPTHMSPQHHGMSPHMGPPPPMPPMGAPHPGQMPMPMPMPMSMPPPTRAPMMMGPMPPQAFRGQPYGSATYHPPAPDFMGEKGPYGSPDLDGRRRRDSDSVPRSSTMAGLDGPAGGVGRVYEWRSFVEPTYDDADSVQS